MITSSTILPVELRDVSFDAGSERLLNGVTCTLEAGPRTVVIGPNGAGKSLLLRLCHGLLQPSRGEIVWRGANGSDPARHQTMVFQRPVLLRRSVAANVDYALSVHRVAKRQRRTMIEVVLAKTGLGRFANHPARVLSAGEQQKLALARAWALSPQVLFLDEPTANLDPAATHAIEEIVKVIHAAGTKIVMTTHDLGQARRLADEVMFLHRGQLLEKGPAEPFFAGPKNADARSFIRGELLWWE